MVTIVSGLPRSGTSLMMQILGKGGVQLLTDDLRKADKNNQKGYFELEKVKKMMLDSSWLVEAEGKAVKIIAQLLNFLPKHLDYKILFMERNLDEVISSQAKMIDNLGTGEKKIDLNTLKVTYNRQIKKIKEELTQSSRVTILYVSYHELIENSENEINKINKFFDFKLDPIKMLTAIDRSLHHEKKMV